MPDASDAVTAALETVLDTDNAESQSASEQTAEVTLSPDEVKAASEKPASKSTDDADDKGSKTVPYDRFSKVVQQKNDVSEQLKALEDQSKTATEREETLRNRNTALETDSQILNAIKELASDPKYKDHVVAIDKALQGIEDEIETAEETGADKSVVTDAEKRLETKQGELEDLIADQNAEKLWDQANTLASSMLDALPDDYTDEDKATLSKLWTPRVDWDGIEDGGREAIPERLQQSLADVIKEYGTPRGALVAQTTKDIEARIPEAKQVSPEDAVKGILSKNWGETSEEGEAVHSDADFSAEMADLMRKVQAG
jgi:small-conductance mechanosensitive channel